MSDVFFLRLLHFLPARVLTGLAFAALVSACSPHPATSAAVSPSRVSAPSQNASGISRTLLDQAELADLPGWETRLFLIEYPPGVAAPKHHHPVAGVGYVLSGSFESAFEGEQPTIVREGQYFRDRPQLSHVLFRNLESSKRLKFLIMYVVRKGEPVLVTP